MKFVSYNFYYTYWKELLFSLAISIVLTVLIREKDFLEFINKSGSDVIQVYGTVSGLLLACQSILISSVKLDPEKLQSIQKKIRGIKDPLIFIKKLKSSLVHNILALFFIAFAVCVLVLSFSFLHFTNTYFLDFMIGITLFSLVAYIVLVYSFIRTFIKFQEVFIIDLD